MPKKWLEIGEAVLQEQQRQKDCIEYLTNQQVNIRLTQAVGKIKNILYGLLSVGVGTLVSILMQKYL